MWCTSLCRVFWLFQAAPTVSFARVHIRAFPEYTHSCVTFPLSSSNGTEEMSSPYSVSLQSPTPCLDRAPQTAATALHLFTEASRHTACNRVSHRFHTRSFENKPKIEESHSATGVALLCCDFFFFLLLTVWHLFHILFCLDESCLCLFCFLLLKGHLDKCLPFKS